MYARLEICPEGDAPDHALIQRFRRGDQAALEILLGRHAEDLYRFCCHLVPNRADAEDICQESLARAIDRVHCLQTGAAFRGWLFRIARNLSVDSFRAARRFCPLHTDSAVMERVQVDGPHASVEAGEERETVAVAFAELKERHQRVLLLREVDGLTYTEIAGRLNVSMSAVETLLWRARQRLRDEYRRSARAGDPAAAS